MCLGCPAQCAAGPLGREELHKRLCWSYVKDMERNELARAIYRTSHLTGLCRLSSGIAASEYSDKYLFASDPALLCAIAECLGAEALV